MYFLIFLFLSTTLFAEDLQKVLVEAASQITLDGKALNYQIVSGNIILKDAQEKEKASICYTAYFLHGVPSKDRPLSFCFNGGPGAASVWLNTGFMGPKRIDREDIAFQDPPYTLVDNESTLLDQTDMVFIDPVSTGFSRPASGVEPDTLHAVDEDVNIMADFIRLFTGQFKRFDSPKYFVGESYGGIRAAKVGYKLHDEYGFYLNGILFISPAFDLQMLNPGGCNDLPYLLALPSFTAIANYHKNTDAKLNEAEDFAAGDYAHALFLGDKLSSEEKKKAIDRISHFTGLSPELIERLNLRIPVHRFIKECMQKEGKVIGRFDGRILGLDGKENDQYYTYDPSIEAVFGAVTSTFSQFLLKEMKWPGEIKDYHVLHSLNWNWGKGNGYVSAMREMKSLLAQNPHLKVVIMHGLYDLAIPFKSIAYATSHLGSSDRIKTFLYPAGHMMYYSKPIRDSMRKDLNSFFR